MAERANIININSDIVLIDDAGDSTCYLVKGRKRALLIDTANGWENLRDIVSKLTQLPLTVINTHGHLDHILGNIFFEEAYLHPADFRLHDEHFMLPPVQKLRQLGFNPCRLIPLKEDEIFDLGGFMLQVIPVPGHTAGSVVLLSREHRMLFTGDAVNGHLWMQLDESLPMGTFRQSLRRLLSTYRQDFDYIMTGHAKEPEDASTADALLEGVQSLLHGEFDNDRPYPWFLGTDRAHPFGRNGEHLIVYNKERLDKERAADARARGTGNQPKNGAAP